MSNLKISGEVLRGIGYPQLPVISIAMLVMERNFKHGTYEQKVDMLRGAALKAITKDRMKEMLIKNSVTLIGGGLDEAPQAYKEIELVMKAHRQLVDVVGTFLPKIVKMDGTASPRKWRKKGNTMGFSEGD